MIKLNELKEKELVQLFSNKIEIVPKYFGNKIIYDKRNNSFYKNKKQKITIFDYLISDLYDFPLEKIKRIKNQLNEDKVYYFTYCEKISKIINENRDVIISSKNFINREKILVKINFLEDLNEYVGENYSSIIINNTYIHSSNCFKTIPDFNFNVVCSDIIYKINYDKIDIIFLTESFEDQIKLEIINNLFLNYCDKNNIFDFNHFKIELPFKTSITKNKKKYLKENIVKILEKNNELLQLYQVFLLLFSKKNENKNLFLSEVLFEKYIKIFNKLEDISINGILKTKIPSFYDFIN